MKLGKMLDLDKCYYTDDGYWSHLDLKEDQLYIVETEDYGITMGTFHLWKPPYARKWNFHPNMSQITPQFSYGHHPKEDGWKSIQEVIK